jgi:hypothetical protein
MSAETIERCDVCREDLRHLSFNGGTSVYRGRFRHGGWFWKGREEKREPSGQISICSQCWHALGQAVRAARAAAGEPDNG